ncbi:MAG: TIGR02452 family protein [Lachnospiraceae bacterium]|nr:TIGR02452 family protein [Lachnospiraceae bacterium]
MSTADERIAVFQDTMSWIDSEQALSASIPVAKKNTTIFYEDDYPVFDASKTKSMHVTISGDRSYQAAMRLSKENPGAKIAVMNFANAFHAGGGVTKGSSAQEESLCRTSTLYPLLYRRTLRDTFYKHHHDLNSPKATDSLIYTEGVIICKTDEDLPKRMPKKDWVTVDVITIAAPDLRDKSNKHAPLVNGGAYMNNAELFGYHVKRAMHMLTCAAAKGADILVLGAFGCGAFQNDPEVVARAYKTVLQEFPKVFKQIEFAIYRPASGSKNYDVFSKILDTEHSEKVSIGVGSERRKTSSSRIELLHASCADQTVDAVVNAANDGLWAGGGICGVIFKKAGMRELTEACEKYETPLKDGEAVITPAFNMKNAKAIIHAVGPNFGVTPTAFEELFKAYYNSLLMLKENGYHSISFPLISSGIFGGDLENPVAESTKQCVRAYKRFVEDYPDYEIDVKLCAFGSSEMEKAKKQYDEQIKKHSDKSKRVDSFPD